MELKACSGVTVVITTYNDAHFLSDALDSVIAQSVRPDEIIVVDDGSTDDPTPIVQRYKGVNCVRQENKGLAAARNTGLKMATGEFMAFLDADDKLRPSALAANLQLIRARPECGFVYGGYSYIDEAGHFQHPVPLQPVGEDAFGGFLTGNLIGMHSTVLYRRTWLEQIGGFDQSLPACEDYDVYLRLSHLRPVACAPICLADYRRHGSNMSNNIPFMLRTALKVLGRQEDLARERPEWTAAYRQGVLNWKDHYAETQARQFIRAVRSRAPLGAQVRNTTRVARIAPRATVRAWRNLFGTWRRRRRVSRNVRFGSLQRTSPFSSSFGFDRGKPVDRRFVESFLASWAADIRGRVLEVGDNEYTNRFGGDRVARSDVLNRYEGHPATTFVSDLEHGDGLPSDAFDCVVLTQTLHLVFDVQSAIATLWRILKPGGVLLVTVPWVSSIDRGEWGTSWYWSLTPLCLKQLLLRHFASDEVEVTHYGNVYSATAFLYGLAEHELQPEKLDVHDPCCPVIVAARARKI